MEIMNDFYLSGSSAEDFERARRGAFVEHIMSLISGHSDMLLSFDDVQKKLGIYEQRSAVLESIPLDRIVGSVGRYRDFTRRFLPRDGASRARWMKLDRALNRMEVIPPIEVYQIGDTYFVRDGNHRASVARINGLTYIDAYVTKIETPIPLESDVQPDDLIRKVEYRDFLEETDLDGMLPGVNVELTEAGRYPLLLEHIRVHRYFLGQERKQPVPWDEAVRSWYHNVYLPIVEAIRKSDILRDFPHRSEADLYLWIAHHREALRERYGLSHVPPPEVAVDTFAEMHSERPLQRMVKRIVYTLQEVLGKDPVKKAVKEKGNEGGQENGVP